MSEVQITCFECGKSMKVETVRLTPHDPAERMLVCQGCGVRYPALPDVGNVIDNRLRLPGF